MLNEITSHLQSLGSQIALQVVARGASLDRRQPIATRPYRNDRQPAAGNLAGKICRIDNFTKKKLGPSGWVERGLGRDELREQQVSAVAARIVVAGAAPSKSQFPRPASEPTDAIRHRRRRRRDGPPAALPTDWPTRTAGQMADRLPRRAVLRARRRAENPRLQPNRWAQAQSPSARFAAKGRAIAPRSTQCFRSKTK